MGSRAGIVQDQMSEIYSAQTASGIYSSHISPMLQYNTKTQKNVTCLFLNQVHEIGKNSQWPTIWFPWFNPMTGIARSVLSSVLSNRRICVIGPDKLIFREFVDMMLHDQMDVTGHKRTNKDTSRHKWIEVCAWTLTNFYFHTQPFDKMLKQSIWITTTVSLFSLVLQSTVHCIHISHMSECTYVPDVLVVTLVAWISLNYSVVETCVFMNLIYRNVEYIWHMFYVIVHIAKV